MKITTVLAGSDCSNGVTCDRVMATDGDDVAVQGRHLNAQEAAVLGITVAPNETVVLINRSLIDELRAG